MTEGITSLRRETKYGAPYPRASEDEIIGFVILIIMGIGSLIAAYIGFRTYMQIGIFSQMDPKYGFALMAMGVEGGVIFLTGGTTHGLKIYKNDSQRNKNEQVNEKRPFIKTKPMRLERTVKTSEGAPLLIPPIVKGPIYGKEAWKMWDVTIADRVPEVPEINWEANDPFFEEPYSKNYVLLYIPKQIIIHDEVKDFGIESLEKMSGIFFPSYVKEGLNNKKIILEELQKREDFQDKHYPWKSTRKVLEEDKKCPFGWKLISTKITPKSQHISYDEMKKVLQENLQPAVHFRMPFTLEATLLILMTYSKTGESLLSGSTDTSWSKQIPFYTRTEDTVIQKYDETIPKPVIVGNCKSGKPHITTSMQLPQHNHGTLAVREFVQ